MIFGLAILSIHFFSIFYILLFEHDTPARPSQFLKYQQYNPRNQPYEVQAYRHGEGQADADYNIAMLDSFGNPEHHRPKPRQRRCKRCFIRIARRNETRKPCT